MRLIRRSGVLVVALCLAWGCQSKDEPAVKSAKARKAEPDYIRVQHILIAFQGTMPGRMITRTREEARERAEEVYELAKSGRDFDELVKEYTDESYPGVYKIANHGIHVDRNQLMYSRDKVVEAFGDVAFKLKVGEIGMAEYDPQKAKYGWHIIKRLE
jgi:parvulin-like peptidyl-prolyl isomerase